MQAKKKKRIKLSWTSLFSHTISTSIFYIHNTSTRYVQQLFCYIFWLYGHNAATNKIILIVVTRSSVQYTLIWCVEFHCRYFFVSSCLRCGPTRWSVCAIVQTFWCHDNRSTPCQFYVCACTSICVCVCVSATTNMNVYCVYEVWRLKRRRKKKAEMYRGIYGR